MGQLIVGAVRTTVADGFLAFGLWSAIPSLLELRMPAPLAVPTAFTMAPASAAATQAPARTTALTTIALTERELTLAAEPYFPQTFSGLTVSAPSVSVSSGRIVLNATARSFFGHGPLVATATPSASGGRLSVQVDSLTVGGLTLPDTIRTQVAQHLQAAIDGYAGSRLQVNQVTTGRGILTLKGTAPP